MFGSRRALRLIERNLYVYRHGWIVILSGFFEPLFYLLSIGFGLGQLVGNVPGPAASDPVPAVRRAGPAGELVDERRDQRGTFNFFFKLKYNKTFKSILSTPLSPGDIALGELGWALIRGGLYALGFMVVMVVLGLFVSPWVILALPGGAARRVRLRGGRHGRDVVHADVAGLRPHPARRAADVPVLRHVLPDRRVPAGPPAFVRITPLYQGVDLHPVAHGRGDLAGPAGPRRVPVDHGLRRPVRSSRAGSTSSCSSRSAGAVA